MDQNIDNQYKEILWDLLANPAENGRSYRSSLERLAQDHPQSGLLQVMYARTMDTPDITKAAAYFNPKALHKILHDPESLLPVSRERVNKGPGTAATRSENYFNIGHVADVDDAPPAVPADEPVAADESLVAIPHDAETVSESPAAVVNAYDTDLPPALPEHTEATEVADDTGSPADTVDEPISSVKDIVDDETPPALPQENETQDEPGHFAEPVEPAYNEPPPLPVEEAPAQTDREPVTPYNYFSSQDEDDEDDNPWDLSKLEEPQADIHEQPVADAPATLAPAEEEEHQEEDSYTENQPVAENYSFGQSHEHIVQEDDHTENVFHHQGEIEDEVYDEIVSIDDIGLESLNNRFAVDDEEERDLPPADTDEFVSTDTESHFDPETERLIYGNIAATDYMSFDKKLDELRGGFAALADEPAAQERDINSGNDAPAPSPVTEADAVNVVEAPSELPVASQNAGAAQESNNLQPTEQPKASEESPVEATAGTLPAQTEQGAKEQPAISKYNDDTLPYSFMWWLDKTRREHAAIYQPYAQPAAAAHPQQQEQVKRPSGDNLQQQYFENIVNLTSVSSIGNIEPPQIAFDHNKKEDVIIERFIQTDPQIKPLSADKLDNENKAKKSSEDQDALVTETLARIYTDQMLYHKAIATYKKLMLKYPEKNSYFAAQIEQLEKKINQ